MTLDFRTKKDKIISENFIFNFDFDYVILEQITILIYLFFSMIDKDEWNGIK